MQSTVDASSFLSAGDRQVVTTSADPASMNDDRSRKLGWQSIIDHRLIEWGRNPDVFDDEDYDPPNPVVIAKAIELATAYCNGGSFPPDSVVPDANGGIVFERRNGSGSQNIHFWGDGTVEYIELLNHKVVDRRKLN